MITEAPLTGGASGERCYAVKLPFCCVASFNPSAQNCAFCMKERSHHRRIAENIFEKR